LANGSRFYVANGGSGTVSVFDAQSFTLRSTITGLQPNPKSIAASGDSSRVYIVSATPQTEPLPASSTSSIAIVNTANDQLLVSQQGDPLQTLPPTVGGCTVSSTTPNCQLQTPDFVFLTQ
jgi:DNA-binding beta-propeller fold protein YncE